MYVQQEYTAEDVVFGAEFENKVSPPTGTWVAIKFANLIDPALLTDVYAAKPWLYSPTLCAMNVVNVVPAPKGSAFSSPIPSVRTPVDKTGSLEGFTSGPDTAFSSRKQLEKSGSVSETTFGKGGDLPGVPSLGTWVPGEIKEDTSLLCSSGPTPFATDSIAGRRKAFQSQKLRRSTTLNPENVYNFEVYLILCFCFSITA